MARSCVTDPRWRELVALYRYDWIAAADVLFGKTPTWQQDLIIESVQEQGSKTSVSSGHGTQTLQKRSLPPKFSQNVILSDSQISP